MSQDNKHISIFGKILSFVNEISKITSSENVTKYQKLLKKTPTANKDAVSKHLSDFESWILTNEKAIKDSSVSNLSDDPIIFREKQDLGIFIPVKQIASQNDKDVQKGIMKHLQLLLCLFKPDEDIKQVIISEKKTRNNEANFLNSFMEKMERQFSGQEFTDPMSATTSVLNSNIFSELVENLTEGVNSGTLDLNSLTQSVQGMMGELQQDPEASQTLNSMMGMMSGLYGNMNFGGMTDNSEQKQ